MRPSKHRRIDQNNVKMVNNHRMKSAGKDNTHNSSEKTTEQQKLEDELKYLTSLIDKHKHKPHRSDHYKQTVSSQRDKFSWTRKHSTSSIPLSSTSSSSSSSLVNIPSPASTLQFHASRSKNKWQKPQEQVSVNFKVAQTCFGEVVPNKTSSSSQWSKPGQVTGHVEDNTATGRSQPITLALNEVVKDEHTTKTETSSNQKCHPATNTSVSPVQTSTLMEITQVVVKSKLSKQNESAMHSKTVGPSEKNAIQMSVGGSNLKTKQLPTTSKHELASKIPNTTNMTLLSQELQKCLSDIAKLKAPSSQTVVSQKGSESLSREQDQTLMRAEKSSTPSVGCPRRIVVTDLHFKSKSSALARKPTTSLGTDSSDNLQQRIAGRSRIVIPPSTKSSSYKWKAANSKTSAEVKESSPSSMCQIQHALHLKPSKQNFAPSHIPLETSSTCSKSVKPGTPLVKVIRTKYKMTKQLSASLLASCSTSAISQNSSTTKTHLSKSEVVPEKINHPKTTTKISRYKLTKSVSNLGSLSSSLATKRATPMNSRFKKVRGHSTKLVKQGERWPVIPHRSQLKLVKSTPKKAKQSSETSLYRYVRKVPDKELKAAAPVKARTRKKVVHGKRSPSVLKSRYKIRKVPDQVKQRKQKPAGSSSPYKWQASKIASTADASQDSFMQRRMKFVLTHTPVLLRTRFRLVKGRNSTKLSPRLGRKGIHVWHNSRAPVFRTVRAPQQPVLKKTRTKIVRKSASTNSNQSPKPSTSHILNVDGVPYQRSRSGRCLRRISSSSLFISSSQRITSRKITPMSSRVWTAGSPPLGRRNTPKMSSTQWVANRVLRRTIQGKINRANRNSQSQQYCKFYNRFGRCHHGDKCPYIHDPERVAVCTQFLRGTCKKTDGTCPFSHKVSKDKMPVCVYFLKGVCNRDNCPYSHVKVSKKAEVCQEFLQGYCPRGEKCKKKHTLECAEFSETGQCKLGSKCPLWHRKNKTSSGKLRRGTKRKASDREAATHKQLPKAKKLKSKPCNLANEELHNHPDPDGEKEDESGSMPSFIALGDDSIDSTPEEPQHRQHKKGWQGGSVALKIRPLFASSTGDKQPTGASTSSAVVAATTDDEDTHLSPSSTSVSSHEGASLEK